MLHWSAIWLLYRKEVLHYIRDRRTILSLVIGPILVNSLLMTGVNYLFAKGRKTAEEKPLTLAVRHLDALPGLRGTLTDARFKLRDSQDPRAEVAAKSADAGIAVSVVGSRPSVQIFGDWTGMDGIVLKTRLNQPLQRLKNEKLRTALAELGATEAVLTPFSQQLEDVASPAKSRGFFLGNILPILLLQFLFVGCIYPAVDMTAGEKERRTIEMTLSAPVRREELVLSKLLAVMTSGIAALFITLTSLAVTLRTMRSSGGPWTLLDGLSLSPATVALVAFAVLPMALLLASTVLSLASAAKSTQEATSYITPLLLVTVVLSMVSFLPGFSLDGRTALVPVANFALAVKGLVTGEWSAPVLALALCANVAYAALGVYFALRSFRREDVLFRA